MTKPKTKANRIKPTKAVTMAPDILQRIEKFRKIERRSFTNAVEVLVLKGLEQIGA